VTYSATRDSEQLRYLQADIANFVLRYQSRPPGPNRRTIFLFPGGMGSQLLRARTPYQSGGPQNQTFLYDKVWLTAQTFLGDALTLKMHDVNGVYHDLDDRIIIPFGSVELFGLTPYTRYVEWCEFNDIDWFIFGWDWRRRLEDTVDFFLNQFLASFQQACPGALQDFVLMGHSFGGMVVSLILQENNSVLANMTRAVTVASPFYGYDGQIHRWFEGEQYLNHLGKQQVIEAIASFPGCYVLPYLDGPTFQANQVALGGDPDCKLNAYPSHDFANGTQMVDPFNPGPNRYPQNIGFSMNELQHALQTYQKIAAGPQAQYAGRFFNIRGIQSPPMTTPGSISWRVLTGPNNPNTSPIGTGPGGKGDGTLPAWSTRLVTLPGSQVVRVLGYFDHMFMMEEDATHQAIAQVL
jgi:pimeloyl-ACP methyl ester carboxylesterase